MVAMHNDNNCLVLRTLAFMYRGTVRQLHGGHLFNAVTGMRVGEATALQWEDVDMDAQVINVRHNLVILPGEDGNILYEFHAPKSKAGIRQIPMTEFV